MATLTESARAALNFIEQEFLLHGQIPSYETYADRLNTHNSVAITPTVPVPLDTWRRWFRDKDFLESLERRGVTSLTLTGSQVLSERQLFAVNAVLDFRNKKSTKTKLAEVGVTTSEYAAWLRDPAFQNYLRSRAERVLDSEMATAHNALVSAVDKGDIRAVQLYYEMTGRWSSKASNELSIDFVLLKVLEIIQVHVKDAQTLSAIADDFAQLTSAPAPSPHALLSAGASATTLTQPAIPSILEHAPVDSAL